MTEQLTFPEIRVTKITATRLNEIKYRVSLATKGPWLSVRNRDFNNENWALAWSTGYSYEEDSNVGMVVTTDGVHASELDGDAAYDADFIAHTRKDIPDLVEEVERLRAIVEAQSVALAEADKVVRFVKDGVDTSNGVKFVRAVDNYESARKEVAKLAELEKA